ncbi:pilus assembly protein TadG-related protein [Nocardia terpenica]|uniref:Flp pilus-assembly TadG-like N-terminal domain-containing protein n=1 Tax=Nocardia terpenica TaxID=455432 RepID=A0A164JMF3_9NOCA|nr:pilus assembly protein TadG-related protein [Nocardia terpenica]KZM70543.1 hypothetical protein AWN90_38815 [Nocardia terpenica]NQE90219.1 hypothetical protein [Nocardia terpenica]
MSTDDHGSFVLWWAIVLFAGLLALGLVVDGGGKLHAGQRAQLVAEDAARAAGQAIVVPLAKQGTAVTLDPLTATGYAQLALVRAQVPGTAIVTGPTTVEVTTTVVYQPKILGLIGIGPQFVTGKATAHLEHTNTGL